MNAPEKRQLAVYIGRFQPFHNGHLSTLLQALQLAEHVLVIVGSSRGGGDRNPFTAHERVGMIRESLSYELNARTSVQPLADHPDDREWAIGVRRLIQAQYWTDKPPYLIGVSKADTGWVSMFHELTFVEAIATPHVSGTIIREIAARDGDFRHLVPTGTLKILAQLETTPCPT